MNVITGSRRSLLIAVATLVVLIVGAFAVPDLLLDLRGVFGEDPRLEGREPFPDAGHYTGYIAAIMGSEDPGMCVQTDEDVPQTSTASSATNYCAVLMPGIGDGFEAGDVVDAWATIAPDPYESDGSLTSVWVTVRANDS